MRVGLGKGGRRKILCVCVCVLFKAISNDQGKEREMNLVCTLHRTCTHSLTAYFLNDLNVARLLSFKNVITHCFSFISSGDDQIKLAGGPGKFVTDVSVKHDGDNIWSGPATFKANCDMQVDNWPFDEQNCTLAFGSFTYGENLLRIKTFKDKSRLTSKKQFPRSPCPKLSTSLLWPQTLFMNGC